MKGGPGSPTTGSQRSPHSATVRLIRPRYVPMTNDEYRTAVRAVAQLLAVRRAIEGRLDSGAHTEVSSASQQNT